MFETVRRSLQKVSISRFATGDLADTLFHAKNYFVANLAVAALTILSMPLLTRLLTTEEYGLYQVFSSYASVFTVVLTCNFFGAVARYQFEDPSDHPEFVGTSLVGSFCMLGISVGIFVLYRDELVALTGLPVALLVLTLPAIVFGVLFSIFEQVCIARKQSHVLAVSRCVKAYLGLAVGLILVLAMQESRYLGLIAGQLTSAGIVAFYALWRMRRGIAWGFKSAHVRLILAYAVPMAPYALSQTLLGHFDRMMINNSVGASEAGLYSLAYNIGMGLSLISTSIHAALAPNWFKLMRAGEYQRADELVVRLFRISVVVALALILLAPEIMVALAAPEFRVALPVVPIVVAGYLFADLFRVWGRSLGYENRMIHLAAVAIGAAVLNVVLNMYFIPRFGYIAGAYTTLVSYAVMALGVFAVARYVVQAHVTALRKFLFPLLCGAGGVMIFIALDNLPGDIVSTLPIRCIVLPIFGWVLLRNNRSSSA